MRRVAIALPLLAVSFAASTAGAADTNPVPATREALGEALFFDVNLSEPRTQSCATCHDPQHGFADPREGTHGASLGADGHSLGDRNAPTASYARFAPVFGIGKDRKPVGGLFHDGRAATLKDQAGGPPLNPIEMGMPSKEAVRQRLRENPAYVQAFAVLYGPNTLDEAARAYDAMADSIAAFERTDVFSPFDSKYDRYLRGEYTMTPEEDLGMTLFFSTQFTNCHQCHQLYKMPGTASEMFTNYEHHNIGVPVNGELRAVNGKGSRFVDHGTLDNPTVKDKAQDGKYKTPTLRNVAVTGPYMHNGVFKELETVIRFYDHYNNRSERAQINPETGKPWGSPEVAKTISTKELESGPALDTKRVKALVAFLKTLTDQRYEYLLQK